MDDIQIPLSSPDITDAEIQAVVDVLRTRHLSLGPKGPEFEDAFRNYLDVHEAVAVNSGTAGLHCCLLAMGIGPGDEVVTTPFSFIATANCVLYGGAEPVFADVDPDTFMLTAATVKAALARDPSIKAIIPVHLYGQAGEMHEIVEIAHAHGAVVIEDCAQAHGATEGGVPVGAIGDLGVFSFYPTKNMTTGEGGIVTGRNADLLARCRLLIDHGAPQRYHHTTLGFNYRMTSLAAAIGLCQFARLPGWNAQRLANAHTLSAALRGLPGITVPLERAGCGHVFHQYVLKVRDRAGLQAHLQAAGVGTAVHYPTTITDQPYYQSLGYSSDATPVARQLTQEVLSLPVHPALTAEDVQQIIAAVRAWSPAAV